MPVKNMDYIGAKDFILSRLKNELPAYCHYHSYAHTLDVLDSVEIIAAGEGVIDAGTLILLRTAAVYHDCGFLEQYRMNEQIAVRIAAEVLPQFGYNDGQIDFIGRMIMATVLEAKPNDLHESIIKDADFYYLGQENYWATALELKKELNEIGMPFSDEQWRELQITFLSTHRFYTASASRDGEAAKKAHINKIVNGIYQVNPG